MRHSAAARTCAGCGRKGVRRERFENDYAAGSTKTCRWCGLQHARFYVLTEGPLSEWHEERKYLKLG